MGERLVVAGSDQFRPSVLSMSKRDAAAAGAVFDKSAAKRVPLNVTSTYVALVAAAGIKEALLEFEPSVLCTTKFNTEGREVDEVPVATHLPLPYAMPVA